MAKNAANEVLEFAKIGEKADLFLGRGPTYRTKIEDITEEGHLVISAPLHRGIPIILRRGQQVVIYFYRQNGRFSAEVSVADFVLSGALRLIKLLPLGEPVKQQRRESFRLQTSLRAIVRQLGLEDEADTIEKIPLNREDASAEQVYTYNISETGVSLKTFDEYVVGDRIFVQIYLHWPAPNSPPLEFLGEVRQFELMDPVKKLHRIGVMFQNCTIDTRAVIAKFVLAEQQRLLKERRLTIE